MTLSSILGEHAPATPQLPTGAALSSAAIYQAPNLAATDVHLCLARTLHAPHLTASGPCVYATSISRPMPVYQEPLTLPRKARGMLRDHEVRLTSRYGSAGSPGQSGAHQSSLLDHGLEMKMDLCGDPWGARYKTTSLPVVLLPFVLHPPQHSTVVHSKTFHLIAYTPF